MADISADRPWSLMAGALIGAAWLALCVISTQHLPLPLCVSPAIGAFSNFKLQLQMAFTLANPLLWALEWALMLLAMMLPLVLPAVRNVAFRSATPNAAGAAALFLSGYALVWIIVAAVATVILIAARNAIEAAGMAGALIGCIIAAAWQLTPAKQKALAQCQNDSFERSASTGISNTAAFGLLHGARCVRACWAPMLLPMLGNHGVAQMAAVFACLFAERFKIIRHPAISAAALLALGLTTLF